MKQEIVRGYRHWINWVVLLLGGALLLTTRSFPELPGGHPGPGLFPAIIGMAFLLAGAILLWRRVGTEEEVKESRLPIHRMLMLLAAVVAVPLVHSAIGFASALGLLICCTGFLMGLVWWQSLAVSVVGTGAIYSLFTWVLQVPL